MLWVVQNNLYNEAGYERFITALERLGVDYLIVKPVPFTNKFLPADFDSMTEDFESTAEPDIDESQKIIVCGATSLSRVAKVRGWNPGSYLNDNFDFETWRDGFGAENILNADSVTGRICDGIDITHMGDQVFARPVDDSKAFAGVVMSKYDFFDWMQSISVIEEEEFQPLHKNTKIAVASFKKINAEYRLFVVDGKVVTASLYKQGNQVIANENVDQGVLDFGQRMVDEWQTKVDCRILPSVRIPADAYVIDIADTDGGFKVIEINNINSAGFYDADVQKIIMALEDMEI